MGGGGGSPLRSGWSLPFTLPSSLLASPPPSLPSLLHTLSASPELDRVSTCSSRRKSPKEGMEEDAGG